MPEAFDNLNYLDDAEYEELMGTVTPFTKLLLFEFARHPLPVRDVIIRNFVARGTATLEAILRLWHLSYYGDCWALFRTLVDRLFHLHALAEQDEFEVFEKWSFIKQYEARNRALSDQEFGPRLNRSVAEATPEQKARYKKLKAENPQWSRPNPKNVAKSLGLPFLYRFGYDFSSTHVHPMANDGDQEFHTLTGIEWRGPQLDYRVIPHNSILVHSLLLQLALNHGTLRWRALFYDFVEQIRQALSGDTNSYRLTFTKIASAGPDFTWSESP